MNNSKGMLIIAPHMEYPLRMGANFTIDRFCIYFSKYCPFVDLVSQDKVYRFIDGESRVLETFRNRERSKATAGIRTLLFRSNYLTEKFLTKRLTNFLKSFLKPDVYQCVVYSYLEILPLRHIVSEKAALESGFVLTHNDEFKWFENLEVSTNNFLIRAVSRQSYQWLLSLKPVANEYVLLHVSPEDEQGFDLHYPGHRRIVFLVGTDTMELKESYPEIKREIVLTFLASLSVKMNYDALLWFSAEIFPQLRDEFGSELKINIIGSNPTDRVVSLCKNMNWDLYANASDEFVENTLDGSDFTLLPFPYSTGVKLKAMKSISYGVPLLGSTNRQQNLSPPFSLFSNNASDWIAHIRRVRPIERTLIRKELLEYASKFSWESSIAALWSEMVASSVIVEPRKL